MMLRERVLNFISVAGCPVSNADISGALGVLHQAVFQETRILLNRGVIEGEQRGREWRFWSREANCLVTSPAVLLAEVELPSVQASLSPFQFEDLAGRVMSAHFGTDLRKRNSFGHVKAFDLVSEDGEIVGDAKFMTLVAGSRIPPAKHSVIAEHVWLLEKTPARLRFLVFGNQREVAIGWLRRYGRLVEGVDFYFLTNDGVLEQLS